MMDPGSNEWVRGERAKRDAEIERLRAALKEVAEYEQDYGGNDWGWRDIARAALEGK